MDLKAYLVILLFTIEREVSLKQTSAPLFNDISRSPEACMSKEFRRENVKHYMLSVAWPIIFSSASQRRAPILINFLEMVRYV